MKVSFLGQGFLADTDMAVGTLIEKFFSDKDFHTFTGITAFASEAGVYGLSNCLLTSPSIKIANLIVGIDQEGTPKDALDEILKLKINSFIFYQKEAPIFHPKIYLFEGDNKTAVIVGSSNLTGRGLFNNVESSTLIEFDNDDADGITYLKSMKDYYATLFDFSDPNLFKISADIIQKFVDRKVVPTKRVWIKKQGKRNPSENVTDALEIPSRKIARPPDRFKYKPQTREFLETAEEEIFAENKFKSETQNLVKVWQSKPLTERDLNIPSGDNTHATGSMLLKKGLLEDIDQRHYFRDSVFENLAWRKRGHKKEHLEKATAFFKIKIDGVDKGEFLLEIGHNTLTNTTTYKQKNAMSQLHWGKARQIIADKNLLKKTLTLYKDTNSDDQFTIEIQ